MTSRMSIRAPAATEATATRTATSTGTSTATAAAEAGRELSSAATQPLPALAVLGAGVADRALQQLDLVALVQAGRDLRETATAYADLHLPRPAAVGHRHGVRRTAGGDRRTRDVEGIGGLRGRERDVRGLADPGVRGELGEAEGGRVRHDAVGRGRGRRDRCERR